MKALVNTGPGELVMQTLAIPEPGAGQVRIRVAACAVCATDLEMIGGWARTSFGTIPGHEWAGTIDAVGGGGDQALVGRHCVAENVWSSGGEVGFEHPGAYAEYLLTEARNVHELPTEFPLTAAALIEPTAVVVRGLGRLDIARDVPVVVIGDGPIGLITLLVLKAYGHSHVSMVGGRPARLELAARLGANMTRMHTELGPSPAEELRDAVGHAIPCVIEASGSPAGAEMALTLVGNGGRVLLLSDYATARADLPWNTFIHRELTILGSNASAGAWPEAVRLVATMGLPVQELISHTLPFVEHERAFAIVREDPSLSKMVLTWP